MKSWFQTYICSLVLSVVIAVVLLKPIHGDLPLLRVPYMDKYVHALIFMLLAGVVLWESKWKRWVLALNWAIFWGGAMELVQNYCLIYRSGDWWDWLADAIGAAVGVGGILWIRNKKKK